MPHRLLVANRGEIAVRVLRAASELGIGTVAVYPDDDTRSLHVRRADEAHQLTGAGVAAYLDGEQILRVAREAGCDAIHPGYGFLAENAAFAQRCAEEGVTFVGPSAELLELFGDKLRARALAAERGVPVLPGATEAVSEGEARAFLESLGPGGGMMIKAVAGGGGRGMRVVRTPAEVAEAFARCQSEAQAAFGDGALYVEQLIEQARHIEVQVAGDGTGAVMHFGERDCSIQRRHQKLIEIAPAPGLPGGLRQRIIDAAVDLAASARYASLGTFEFLVDARDLDDGSSFAFIEANPRLQVEHTITEEVTGIDLVQLQLRLADGATLAELGMSQADLPAPRGFAIQARVNLETIRPDGAVLPSGGRLTAFEPPGGPGVRTDTFGYAGYETSMRFDSLLAKVIGHTPSPSFEEAVRRTHRALREFRIEGVQTNIPFLLNVLDHPGVRAARLHTAFIDDYLTDLLEASGFERAALHFADTPESAGPDPAAASVAAPEGTVTVEAHLQGTVVSLEVAEGDTVRAGQQLAVLEALKMEHVIEAPSGGVVRTIVVRAGETVHAGVPLLFLEPSDEAGEQDSGAEEIDLDAIRPDLAEVERRRALALDAGRPAVQRHHERGGRAARENIEDLCDPGTFVEYGQLAIPSDVNRPVQELIERYPGDGLVMGLGSINGSLFGEPTARCVVLAYDYTVLAGTQGRLNHRKSDRMLDIAAELRAPVVWFTEGGGGRAHGGGGDPFGNASGGWGGLETPTWRKLGQLSGLVPLVAINSGYSFAGNAAVLGSCDVVIATGNSSIGMGGPAMIEGGGLGIYTPDQVGPMSVQRPNGVVDLAVEDEAEAVQAAKQYLSYFQGNLDQWDAEDQRLLRRVIPEHRLRVYDVRRVINTMADAGSVMELRRDFGLTMVTALARIEGRPLGIIANNPLHLSGAIDSDGADKAARFMQLCDAFDLPVVFLCDTPGIMVGPEAEKTALVRHSSRMFVIGANLTVPTITVVLRKAYGLGAMTMAAGSFKATQLTVSWPTGEFGAMGLEGMVRLGSREELDAIDDPEEREARFTELVAVAYERGKALNSALGFGLDDVIDPADTRALIANVLRSQRPPAPRERKKRPYVDPW